MINIKNKYLKAIFLTAFGTLALPIFFLPYRYRVKIFGWYFENTIAFTMGFRRRIRLNLNYIFKDKTTAELHEIERKSANNIGRVYAELISIRSFLRQSKRTEMSGEGLKDLKQSKKENRPCIVVTAHIGNHFITPAVLTEHGYDMGFIYRKRRNRYFRKVASFLLSKLSKKTFGIGSRGDFKYQRNLHDMILSLKNGEIIGGVLDQRVVTGVALRFFGKKAYTSVSFANLAIKYDALFIPCFAIRSEDGSSFTVTVDKAIPNTSAEEMMQTYNDRVEQMIRQYPSQWFWKTKRWENNLK